MKIEIDDFLSQLKNAALIGDNITPLFVEYPKPELDRKEVFRYAGIPFTALKPEELEKKLDEAVGFTENELAYRVAYCCIGIKRDGEGRPVLPFEQDSGNLATNLKDCRGAIIFAATIGSGIDRMIRRYERLQPSMGLLLQGYGAERVESLCDLFNDEVSEAAKKAGLRTHPRYSPGFGDLSIEVQPKILGMLNAEKRLGISLNSSYLMSPSKSVTAIIGIE